MRKEIPLDAIEEIIGTVRANKRVELAGASNEATVRSATRLDEAEAVDRALVELSQALRDALDGEDQDQPPNGDGWWGNYEPEHPSDWWEGGLTLEDPFPRNRGSAS